jgi:transglutaminase-like putative cysteine protease
MKKLLDANLYWRGIVLDEFDGRSWKSTKGIHEASVSPTQGELVYQTIYLEPYGNEYLFSLDFPLHVSRRGVRQLSGMTFSMNEEISKRTKYTVTSMLSSILPDIVVDRERLVRLPSFPSRKIAELVRELSANKSEPEKIQAFHDYLKLGDFKYSMENLPVSEDALEEFLFTNKRGNCEYFASALAVMLRMAGIPARLIGGYAGGYYNETGNYYMVLQKNAHVWVEVYVNDRGWVRLDPTPASPQTSHGRFGADVLMKLQLALDTFNYYWNRFIITYDFSRQIALFKKIRSSLSKPAVRLEMDPVVLGKYVACLLLLSSLFLVGIRASKHHRSNRNRLVVKFVSKMRQYGYDREKTEGLEEFVCRVSDESLRSRAYEFVTCFEAIYYKDGKFTKEDVRSLKKRIAEL